MATVMKDNDRAQERRPNTQLEKTPREAVTDTRKRRQDGKREAMVSDPTGMLRMGSRMYPIWTPAMVRRLKSDEEEGKRWHLLIDKVGALTNLREAWRLVAANKGSAGISGQTIEDYSRDLEARLNSLSRRIQCGHYHPRPIRRAYIPKTDGSGKMRPLGIPEVEDRIVQTAIVLTIEPIFEVRFLECSFGFRPARGAHNALHIVETAVKGKKKWVVDGDIKDCFGSFPHDLVMQQVKTRINDRKLLTLIQEFLQAEVVEAMNRWKPTVGSPQGATLSPLLANIYMHVFDTHMMERGYEVVRYADDFVILCETEDDAMNALETARQVLESMGLVMHPEKSKVVDSTRGDFQFLGYIFAPWGRKPRPSSLAKMRDAIRMKTRRLDGRSIRVIIRSLNRTLRGWYKYFRYGAGAELERLDQMVRRRLRSILRKRAGRQGTSKPGADHKRYTNAGFKALGVFELWEQREKDRGNLRFIPFPAKA